MSVVENCIKCRYMDCVEVCPVDCFDEGENMLVIHPDECIDCGVCEPECPAEAIKPDTEPSLASWLKVNADLRNYGQTLRPNGSHRPTERKLTDVRTSSPTFFPRTRPGGLTTFESVRVALTAEHGRVERRFYAL